MLQAQSPKDGTPRSPAIHWSRWGSTPHQPNSAMRAAYGPLDSRSPLSDELITVEPVARDTTGDTIRNHLPDQQAKQQQRPRRVRLPVILFVFTCISTFFVGVAGWQPILLLTYSASRGDLMPIRQRFISDWVTGLIYMTCVLAILLTHEMGHFIATIWHRIRASLPIFLPFPINPLGTLGAVIFMDAMKANRRQMFDIGIAGPVAGLILAVPIMWYGVVTLDMTKPAGGQLALDMPLATRLLLDHYQPHGYVPGAKIWMTQLNPFFMAGWAGLLVTGLNMFPISQLDGGHISYTLFGRYSHWIARSFMIGSIAYMVYVGNHPMWLMVILILLLGTDHPPTRDDSLPLGWFRTMLGFISLSIPILTFPPRIFFFADV